MKLDSARSLAGGQGYGRMRKINDDDGDDDDDDDDAYRKYFNH